MTIDNNRDTDLDQIRALYERYNTAFDGGDVEGYAQVFTEDGIFTLPDGKVMVGRDRLRHLATAASSRPGASHHFVLNVTAEVDGDSARGAAHVVAVSVDGSEVGLLMAGVYRDELSRVDGSWLFSRRVATAFGPSDITV
jgi:uncharacterized protein (TIGR02246 family)